MAYFIKDFNDFKEKNAIFSFVVMVFIENNLRFFHFIKEKIVIILCFFIKDLIDYFIKEKNFVIFNSIMVDFINFIKEKNHFITVLFLNFRIFNFVVDFSDFKETNAIYSIINLV